MKKAHVAVLMGGMSSEHEVSLNSGANAVEALREQGYPVTRVVIERSGIWHIDGQAPGNVAQGVLNLLNLRVDCVFLALHGPGGEDGRIQGMLDLAGLPYTGSGHAASAVAMDKIRSKAVAERAGIRVARQLVLFADTTLADVEAAIRRIVDDIGMPCVVKSPCQGSSLGMAIPRTHEELRASLPPLFDLDESILVEEFLDGPEVTCGVLDVDARGPIALPVTEIRPVSAEFFDYTAKYTPGACREITPAEIPASVTRSVQEVAVLAHRSIGCRGFSRSDMILVDGVPVWLEINTIPGMTNTSLVPQAAAVAGITFPELVAMLVEAALAAHRIAAHDAAEKATA